MKREWKRLDTNGDGVLDRSELTPFLTQLSHTTHSPQLIQEWTQAIDAATGWNATPSSAAAAASPAPSAPSAPSASSASATASAPAGAAAAGSSTRKLSFAEWAQLYVAVQRHRIVGPALKSVAASTGAVPLPQTSHIPASVAAITAAEVEGLKAWLWVDSRITLKDGLLDVKQVGTSQQPSGG
jgi:hypothetical protein